MNVSRFSRKVRAAYGLHAIILFAIDEARLSLLLLASCLLLLLLARTYVHLAIDEVSDSYFNVHNSLFLHRIASQHTDS